MCGTLSGAVFEVSDELRQTKELLRHKENEWAERHVTHSRHVDTLRHITEQESKRMEEVIHCCVRTMHHRRAQFNLLVYYFY